MNAARARSKRDPMSHIFGHGARFSHSADEAVMNEFWRRVATFSAADLLERLAE